jgi:diguanylate cyclase (GGDEF)-like protein
MNLSEKQIQGVVFTCDKKGDIEEVLYAHPDMAAFQPGAKMARSVPATHYERAWNAFEELRKTGSAFDVDLVLEAAGNQTHMSMSGVYKDGRALIAIAAHVGDLLALFRAAEHAPGQSARELRPLLRDILLTTKKVRDVDLALYDRLRTQNAEIEALKAELADRANELAVLSARLDEATAKDPLTGLFNRGMLEEKFRDFVQMSRRLDFPLTLILIDVNDFHAINERLGFDGGDAILARFGETINAYKRKGLDNAFRIGGDDILLMVGDCDEKNAVGVAVRLDLELRKISEDASIGYGIVAVDTQAGTTLEEYVRTAEERLQEYKRKNRRGRKSG